MATGWGGLTFAIVMGLLWGSFANVCIYRWPPSEKYPKGRSVVRPGSHCFACGAQVRWYDNVPILAWLWLRGRCRDCGATFSARYLWVEALTGLLFGLAWYQIVVQGAMFEALPDRLIRWGIVATFALTMVVIAFIDLDHKLILDKVTYPAIPLFYGLGLLLPERSWSEGLIGAAIGYGVIRAVSDGYYYLTGREGLGYGDGKLLAIVGALVGWRGVLFGLFAGSVLGTIFGVLAIALRGKQPDEAAAEERGDAEGGAAESGAAAAEGADGEAAEGDDAEPSLRHMELPFGPYLAAAAMFYVLAEPWLRVNLWFLRG